MRDMMTFSNNTIAMFDNNYDNMLQFNSLLMDAANNVYGQYSKEETNTIIRNQMDKILGINYAEATPMKRRQAWRARGIEVCALIEDVILDKMNSGWNEANAKFMGLVEDRNLALGDTAEFFVEDTSLLVVSKFAGSHHDVCFLTHPYRVICM